MTQLAAKHRCVATPTYCECLMVGAASIGGVHVQGLMGLSVDPAYVHGTLTASAWVVREVELDAIEPAQCFEGDIFQARAMEEQVLPGAIVDEPESSISQLYDSSLCHGTAYFLVPGDS